MVSTIIIIIDIVLGVGAIVYVLPRYLCGLHSVNANPSVVTTPPIITAPPNVLPEIPSSVVIDMLPLYSVTSRSSTSVVDCAVCLSEFDNNDLLRILPRCCHAFHAYCIDMWIRSNLSCPLCRSPIATSDSDLANILQLPSGNSFRIEIGSVSSQGTNPDDVTPLVLRRVEGPLVK